MAEKERSIKGFWKEILPYNNGKSKVLGKKMCCAIKGQGKVFKGNMSEADIN